MRRNLNGQIAVVATGRWMPDIMRVAELQPTIDAPSMPPIEIAIGRALQLRTAIERPPTKHAVSPTPPKRKRGFWKKVGSAIGTFFVIVGAILWTCLRLSEDKRPNGTECDFDSQCASDNCARGPDHTEHCRAVYDHNLTNGSYCYKSSECQSGYCNWQNACVGR